MEGAAVLPRLTGVLRAVGRAAMSRRGRVVWTRLLAAAALVAAAPYLTVLWRIMLGGSASDQCVLIATAGLVTLARSGVRAWRRGGGERVGSSHE